MGAKTRLCEDFIAGAVADLLPEGGTFLDLCAGTSAVARSFAPTHRVLANDVQNFSAVIARAHLEGEPEWPAALEHLDPESDLGSAILSHRRSPNSNMTHDIIESVSCHAYYVFLSV